MKPPPGVSEALPETCRLIVTGTNEPGVASAAHVAGSGQNHVSKCDASAREEPRSLATATPAAPMDRLIRAWAYSPGSTELIELRMPPERPPLLPCEIGGMQTLPQIPGTDTRVKAEAIGPAAAGNGNTRLPARTSRPAAPRDITLGLREFDIVILFGPPLHWCWTRGDSMARERYSRACSPTRP